MILAPFCPCSRLHSFRSGQECIRQTSYLVILAFPPSLESSVIVDIVTVSGPSRPRLCLFLLDSAPDVCHSRRHSPALRPSGQRSPTRRRLSCVSAPLAPSRTVSPPLALSCSRPSASSLLSRQVSFADFLAPSTQITSQPDAWSALTAYIKKANLSKLLPTGEMITHFSMLVSYLSFLSRPVPPPPSWLSALRIFARFRPLSTVLRSRDRSLSTLLPVR